MIPADIGNDTQHRSYDIGGVKSSPESCFYNSYIHTFFSKIQEGHGNGDLKKTGFDLFNDRSVSGYKICNKRFFTQDPIDTDAFTKIEQVRRGVEACLMTR